MTAPSTLSFNNEAGETAILLTCYMSGSTEGRNLGTAGYSYDFVAKLFADIFEKRAKVIPVHDPVENLDAAAVQAKSDGYTPVHVSFLPFQDVHLCSEAPNIVVPAWEFPDVPNEAFDDDERNDWVAMANQCDLVIVGGPFTVESLKRGGVTTPIRVVPVPTPDAYFQTEDWEYDQDAKVECGVYWPKQSSQTEQSSDRKYYLREARKLVSQSVRSFEKAILGPERYAKISDYFRERRRLRKAKKARRDYENRRVAPPEHMELNYPKTNALDVSGVVYSSIFNPDDGRKNWHDLLTSFLYALGDREDATLVIKLITRRPESAQRIMDYYVARDIPHRCKVGFIVEYLSEEKMQRLASASTYYFQTTRAEGNCLPLMNALAAGRPGLSPCHSAMGDYFDDQVGFVIDSNPEPAVWPHDPEMRFRTSWGRLVWPSAVKQLRDSYQLAKSEPARYSAMSGAAKSRLGQWASIPMIESRIGKILDEFEQNGVFDHVMPEPTAIQSQEQAA